MHADTSEVAKGELVVNPDAVKNQPEGGMIQSANWAAQGAGPVR